MSGRDPLVVGKELRLSGVNYRVVGVMPETFAQPGREARLWTPLTWEPRQGTDDGRHSNNWDMVARLKPGVTVALAQQRIDALNRRNIENSGKMRKLRENACFGTTVPGLKEELVGGVRPTLYLLQCAVAFILPIGCVNVANPMLGIGVAGALAITRLMTTMLYSVRPTDPLVFGSVAAALMAVAVAASALPSLRIARIRPANALR
jgi:hypothetical protein